MTFFIDNVERFVMFNNAQWAILVVAIKSFAATSAPLFILSLITRRLGVDKDSFLLFTPTFIPVLSLVKILADNQHYSRLYSSIYVRICSKSKDAQSCS